MWSEATNYNCTCAYGNRGLFVTEFQTGKCFKYISHTRVDWVQNASSLSQKIHKKNMITEMMWTMGRNEDVAWKFVNFIIGCFL